MGNTFARVGAAAAISKVNEMPANHRITGWRRF
jgi:hypothetical protein